jgi:ArsR family transcriptional regulator
MIARMGHGAPPFAVVVSPRFEGFHALWQMTGRPAAARADWCRRARRRLGRPFAALCEKIGGAAAFWVVLADAPGTRPAGEPFEATIRAIARLPPRRFAMRVLENQLHHLPAVRALLDDPEDVARALAMVPPTKREWLQHFGVYPLRSDSPGLAALRRLARDPAEVQQAAVAALDLFWRRVFKAEWERLVPRLEPAAEAARALIAARGLTALANAGQVNLDIDMEAGELAALRGGYRIGFGAIAEIRAYPSVFNTARFWTVLDGRRGEQVVHLPFLIDEAGVASVRARPTDPALAFRALGDPTRFALASLIAARPMTSVELARALAVSKPTVTHHVHLLREAGLIDERAESRAVWLSLRRSAIAGLSRLALNRLFGAKGGA